MLALLLALSLTTATDTIPTAPTPRGLGLGVTVGAGMVIPLERADPADFGPGRSGATGSNGAMRFVVTGHALGGLSATVNLYRYVTPRLQAPWDPDFTYSIRYETPWTSGLSVEYANYDANRLQPDAGEPFTRLERGVVTLAYGRTLEAAGLGVASAAGVRPFVSYDLIPVYYDASSNDLSRGKHRTGIGVLAMAPAGFFAHAAVYVYPDPERQQPWDPDLTYGFGFSAGGETHVSIYYENYSGTRFPWREPGERTGRFGDGKVTFLLSRHF